MRGHNRDEINDQCEKELEPQNDIQGENEMRIRSIGNFSGLFGKSLMTRMTVLFLLIAAVPVALVGYLSYSSAKEMLQELHIQELESLAESHGLMLKLFFEAKKGRMEDFASDGHINKTVSELGSNRSDLQRVSADLSDYLITFKQPLDPDFNELYVVDENGLILASTNTTNIGSDKRKEGYFRNSQSQSTFGDIRLKDAEGREKVGFVVAAPLAGIKTRKYVGSVVGVFHLDNLQRWISEEGTNIGESGETYVVQTVSGIMITESRFQQGNAGKLHIDTEPVRKYRDHGETMTGLYTNYRGLNVVGASSGKSLSRDYGIDWMVISEIGEDEAFASVGTMGNQVLWISIVIGIFVSLFGFLTARGMANPIRHVASQIEEVSKGNLRIQVERSSRQDEIGTLTNAFAKMVDNSRNMTSRITESSETIVSSASEIMAAINQVSSSALEIASSVQETSTTMEEVRQTAQLATDKSREVFDNAKKVATVADEGKQLTEATIAQMGQIKEQIQSIGDSTIKLAEQNQSISDIIDSVNDLAEQSNLLAVNASIEAARAGEHGKGFGVVAQEIKSLADQSKTATIQVRGLLTEIQRATSSAVMATEQGTKSVDAGVSQAAESGQAIVLLAKSVSEAATAANQISTSSEQQLSSTMQVAEAIKTIGETSTQNASTTSQLRDSMEQLNKVGQTLKQLTAEYSL